MEPLVLTSRSDLDRLVKKSVYRAVEKALQKVHAPPGDSKKWVSNSEAMDYLGLSRPTLQRYRKSGKLPYSKVGRNVYYRLEDVEALLERNIQST